MVFCWRTIAPHTDILLGGTINCFQSPPRYYLMLNVIPDIVIWTRSATSPTMSLSTIFNNFPPNFCDNTCISCTFKPSHHEILGSSMSSQEEMTHYLLMMDLVSLGCSSTFHHSLSKYCCAVRTMDSKGLPHKFPCQNVYLSVK